MSVESGAPEQQQPTARGQSLVGVRAFWLDSRLRLRSTGFVGHAWYPGVNRALCGGLPLLEGSSHAAPHRDCGCGFYVMRDMEALLGRGWEPMWYVFGVVRAWGLVVPHERGFRAQCAEILAITSEGYSTGFMSSLARRYGVPVIAPDSLDLFAKEHGTSDARAFPVAPQEQRPDVDRSPFLTTGARYRVRWLDAWSM